MTLSSTFSRVVAAGLFVVTIVLGSHAQTSAPATSKPARGVVEGRLKWSGPVFIPREVVWPEGTRGVDIKIDEILGSTKIVDESLRVDQKTRGIADACVRYLDALMPHQDGMNNTVSIKLLRFTSRAVVMRPGQRLIVANDDPITYDVTMSKFGDKLISEHRVEPGMKKDLGTITEDGVILRTKRFPFMMCVVFAGERGPQIVTTDDGSFRFAGVPAGTAHFEIMHPMLGRKTFDVEVKSGETSTLNVTDGDLVTTKDDLRLFASVPDPALTIDGIDIPKPAIQRYVDYMRLRHADHILPQNFFEGFVIRQTIIPLAATFAANPEGVRRIGTRIETIRRLMQSGRSFGELASGFSEEGLNADPGGVRERSRLDLDPVIGERVFAASIGSIVGPVFSTRGAHFFQVESTMGQGAEEKRKFRHLVLRYDPSTSLESADRQSLELGSRAKVVVHDAALKALVPEENQN